MAASSEAIQAKLQQSNPQNVKLTPQQLVVLLKQNDTNKIAEYLNKLTQKEKMTLFGSHMEDGHHALYKAAILPHISKETFDFLLAKIQDIYITDPQGKQVHVINYHTIDEEYNEPETVFTCLATHLRETDKFDILMKYHKYVDLLTIVNFDLHSRAIVKKPTALEFNLESHNPTSIIKALTLIPFYLSNVTNKQDCIYQTVINNAYNINQIRLNELNEWLKTPNKYSENQIQKWQQSLPERHKIIQALEKAITISDTNYTSNNNNSTNNNNTLHTSQASYSFLNDPHKLLNQASQLFSSIQTYQNDAQATVTTLGKIQQLIQQMKQISSIPKETIQALEHELKTLCEDQQQSLQMATNTLSSLK
ncbi:MAG: hypothetical protein Tsb005_15830 [Gammaproteobacteria bacterium]